MITPWLCYIVLLWVKLLNQLPSKIQFAYPHVPNEKVLNSTIRCAQLNQRVFAHEGKMVWIYGHRQADIVVNPRNASRKAQNLAIDDKEKTNPSRLAIPQYWLQEDLVSRKRYNPVERD